MKLLWHGKNLRYQNVQFRNIGQTFPNWVILEHFSYRSHFQYRNQDTSLLVAFKDYVEENGKTHTITFVSKISERNYIFFVIFSSTNQIHTKLSSREDDKLKFSVFFSLTRPTLEQHSTFTLASVGQPVCREFLCETAYSHVIVRKKQYPTFRS
jgi:hypothetical protein